MDMTSDDTSSSPGGQNEMDDQPLQEADAHVFITTTSAEDNFNPFNNNDTVLPMILSLLPLRDLKTARIVSRRWNQLSAKYFHSFCSAAQIYFCESETVDSPWAPDGHIPHGLGDMAAFTQDVRARGTCSFRRFDLGASVMRSTGTVSDFLSVCRPYIEELNVGKEYEEMEVMFKQTQIRNEQIILTSPLTSLRVLRVNVERQDQDAFLRNFFDFVGMIIQGSTNLESLTLRLRNLSGNKVTKCVLPSLRLCNLDKLTTLEISAEVTAEHFMALSGIQGLRLKSLDLWSNIDDPGPFRQFLESQSGSLESLRLSGVSHVIEFPHMRSLKSLEVNDYDIYGCFTFPTLSYPQQFTSLEVLIVNYYCEEFDHQLFRADLRPCLTLQELVVKRDFEDGMSLAASLFPNVKRLEVPWSTVTQAYSLFPQLEELTFGLENGHYRVALIDDLITGIPNEECERIHREGSYEAVLRNLTEVQTTPSITRLKRLRTLKFNVIKQDYDGPFMRITEASFHLALFHMESLETLDFGFTPLSQISKECMEAIRGRFKIKSKPI